MPAIQDIYDDDSHAGDIDLMCNIASWDSVHAFDWEAKVPNTTVDVLRGVQVGLTKDEKGGRLLLIRFVDTQLESTSPMEGPGMIGNPINLPFGRLLYERLRFDVCNIS
jgi:hypothetical protein